MVLVAYLLLTFTSHRIMPAILVGLAALVLIGGLALPPLFHAFEKFGAWLARWVSAGLTWGLLVPFFYLVFGFGRLVLVLSRKDPLHIRFPAPDCPTFWIPRPPVRNLAQYRKQH
jgi:predicted histidine transporter YuiF (NhaC family)